MKLTSITNFSEFERWLCCNTEKALEYFRKNDIYLSDIKIEGRTATVLRVNRKSKISHIILVLRLIRCFFRKQ